MDITPQKIATLRFFAQADATAKRSLLPVFNSRTAVDEAIALARFMAHSEQFLPEDWNLDNQKRNVAIRMFLDFPLDVLRQHGHNWLERWRNKNGMTLWFQEWQQLIETAPDDVLARVLLSSEEEPTRQRLSMPFSGLLEADVVLQVKVTGIPI